MIKGKDVKSRAEEEAELLAQVLKLPKIAEQEIVEDYLDSNGHVNMMYFTMIANMGWRAFFDELGMQREHLIASHRSTFALRQYISYYNELREGDRVAVHGGLVDFDDKRVHFVYYIVNTTTHKLASGDERLILYMDMQSRKAATFEPSVLLQLEKVRLEHLALGWRPELSGAMKVKK